MAHNFAAEWDSPGTSFGVWRFDRNWANPVKLFSTSRGVIGVTYDVSAQSLWISLDLGNIQQVAMDGTVLSQFNPGMGRFSALAWEPATDTLWVYRNEFPDRSNELRQYSKTGTLLQTLIVPGIEGNTFGGEFAIPAPPGLGVLGAAGLLLRRRRS